MTDKEHTKWLKNLHEKAKSFNQQKNNDSNDQQQLRIYQQLENDDPKAKLDLFKKRSDKPKDFQDFTQKYIEQGQKKDNFVKNYVNPEILKSSSYFRTPLDNNFNPILSSQKFQSGPGRFRDKMNSLALEDKRNTYNENRKISLPYNKFITLEIFSGAQIALRFHKFYDEGIKNKIRNIQGAKFLMDNRAWVIGLPYYDKLLEELKKVCETNQIHIEEIPQFVMNLILHKIPFTGPEMQVANHNYTDDQFANKTAENLPKFIYEVLKKHQIYAINKAMKRNGRIILNDKLGLGKRLVAISISLLYKLEWPLLIICPNVLKNVWQEEYVKWLPNFNTQMIQVFGNSSSEDFRSTAKIFIVSFQLLQCEEFIKKYEKMHFKIGIVDQASFLKQNDQQWSQNIIQDLMLKKRIILLTGVDFQNNQFEVYNLLKIIRPDYIPDFLKFCYRYCDPVKKKSGIEFQGKSFHQELELLCRKRFSISRSRDDSNIDIPLIQRQKIEISCTSPLVQQVQNMIQTNFFEYEKENQNVSVFKEILLKKQKDFCQEQLEWRQKYIDYFKDLYQKTALCKIKHIIEYCDILLENGVSFIVVGYHEIILEAIKAALEKRSVHFINLSQFFRLSESSTNQSMVIEQLRQLPNLFDEDNKRIQDHLFVGILSYDDFTKNYKDISKTNTFQSFNKLLSQHFEAVLFSEPHYKISPVKKIEQLIQFKKKPSQYTVDEYIFKLLYHQDKQLWQELEPIEVDEFKRSQVSLEDHKINLRVIDINEKKNSQEQAAFEFNTNINTQTFEFYHPPTQSYYDSQNDKIEMRLNFKKFDPTLKNKNKKKTYGEKFGLHNPEDLNHTQTKFHFYNEDDKSIGGGTQSLLYGNNMGESQLNMESQLSKGTRTPGSNNSSQMNKSQTSQQSMKTVNSLSASQFRKHSDQNSARSSQISSGSQQLSQQRTLFDYQKLGFGIFKKGQNQDVQNDDEFSIRNQAQIDQDSSTNSDHLSDILVNNKRLKS